MAPEDKAALAGTRMSTVVDPTRATTSAPQPIFTVEATADSVSGNASVGWIYRDLVFDAKFAGPINSPRREAEFADLDGLRNGTTIDLGAQYMYWNPADPAPLLIPACKKLAEIEKKTLKDVDCTLSNLRAKEKELGIPLAPTIDPGNILLFGGRYKVGRNSFDYVSPVDLSAGSEAHTDWAISLGAAAITRNNWLFGGGYRREVKFVAGSGEVELCVPLGVGDATVCSPAVLGAPLRREVNQFYAEARKFFGPIAISPRFTGDFSRDISAFDVPLYFLKNTEGGFTGGVRVGWRSDRKGLTVVGFVGQVLGILTVP